MSLDDLLARYLHVMEEKRDLILQLCMVTTDADAARTYAYRSALHSGASPSAAEKEAARQSTIQRSEVTKVQGEIDALRVEERALDTLLAHRSAPTLTPSPDPSSATGGSYVRSK